MEARIIAPFNAAAARIVEAHDQTPNDAKQGNRGAESLGHGSATSRWSALPPTRSGVPVPQQRLGGKPLHLFIVVLGRIDADKRIAPGSEGGRKVKPDVPAGFPAVRSHSSLLAAGDGGLHRLVTLGELRR